MKSNKSSKNFKSATSVLTIVLCIGLAFSLITVQQTEGAIFSFFVAVSVIFVCGMVVGWLATESHNPISPDALITSEENYVLVWNDFLETWNNNYIDENVDLHNYMMMFNLTYLDSVRRAEHDVASYVHFLTWADVESNMSSLVGYKENVTKFITATLHGYNRVDVSILQHMYDTDVWSYTTPMKYGKRYHTSSGVTYEWVELTKYTPNGYYYQYKATFGTYPVGYNGGYNIGDKFYVTYIYVPNGNFITLKDLDSNIETTYYDGVHDLEGKRNEVIDVTIRDSGYAGFDNTGVYLFGVPTDFDMLVDTFISYNTGLDVYSRDDESIVFEKSKFVESFVVSGQIWLGAGNAMKVYVNDVLFQTIFPAEGLPQTITVNDYVYEITTVPYGGVDNYGCVTSINTEGYIYPDLTGGLRVDTEHVGSVYITDSLPARGRVGLDWMVNSYKTIYAGMIANAKVLWNLYHANGWYSTDDIPSEFLVVPPDIIFDNMDALRNLPLDKAQAIYYTWMKQLLDFYDENPDYTGTYDDTDLTVFDDGIIINATLVHGGNTIFSNHLIYISPLLGDLEICKDNYYNLTQKIFIYDITATYIYYGYVGDNLTIHNITIESVETDCVILGRQTMHDFLLGKYGFSISFTGEWQFPEIEDIGIYMSIAVACLGFGIAIAIFGKTPKRNYRPIGYLLIIIGSGIIIYTVVIPAIQSFLDLLIFWD